MPVSKTTYYIAMIIPDGIGLPNQDAHRCWNDIFNHCLAQLLFEFLPYGGNPFTHPGNRHILEYHRDIKVTVSDWN